MSIQSRLEKLEKHAGPFVDWARARRVEIEKLRIYIQPDLDGMVALAQYCGLPFNREHQEGNIIEGIFLGWAEWQERPGDARLTDEQMAECISQSDIKFYGVEYMPEELIRAGDVGEQAREDMRAGIPPGESKAAQEMIRQHAIQTARLKKHTEALAAHIAGRDSRIPDRVFDACK